MSSHMDALFGDKIWTGEASGDIFLTTQLQHCELTSVVMNIDQAQALADSLLANIKAARSRNE